ncbi:Na/Pi cotransporter family protein [bacterium]|nr:Na/Pi cotransporter family protein [bacterium]
MISPAFPRFLLLIALMAPVSLFALENVDSLSVGADSLVQNLEESTADSGLKLSHPVDDRNRRISGDGRTMFSGGSTELRVRVIGKDREASKGKEVHFHLLSPESRVLGISSSDDRGIASFELVADAGEGDYAIMALLPGQKDPEARLILNLPVKRPSWVLFMLFGLAGGLGLFLFGMDMMSSSLQRGAGRRMRGILSVLTRNRVVGLAMGAVVTMVIQSSSATTVVLVSFVQAGLMSFAQTLGVILGADIGTTITAQLIAFKLTDYALLIIAVGFALRYLTKKIRLKQLGDAMLGFGILFFGLSIMGKAMEPLRSYKPFIDSLAGLENPILGIVVGAAFTAMIQSSSAFSGIIIVMAQQGFLGLEAGIPLLFGANIGTCVTAALASLNAGREAKRVALAHTLFKVLGVLIMVAWIPQFTALVRHISGSADLARQVANAHTIFNVGIALLFLPFTPLFAKLIVRMLPDRVEPVLQTNRARHLDATILNAPVLALNLAKVEILRMGEKVKEMAEQIIPAFFDRNLEILDTIHGGEDMVDDLQTEISAYLLDIGKQRITKEQTEEVYLMMHVTKQYEHVADIIDKELRPLARKMAAESVAFSESGETEVRAFHLKMLKQISRSLEAFRDNSLDEARNIEAKHQRYRVLELDYRQAHYARVRSAVSESVKSSEYHLDLMDALRRIDSYSTNIAHALLNTYQGERKASDS